MTANLKKITAYAAGHEKQFMKLLIQQNEDGGKRRNAARKKELEAAEKRISELSAIFKRLYEDRVAGRISDERFTELSADYEAEQKQEKERAARLEAELAKAQEATANAEKFMDMIHRHTSFEELPPPCCGSSSRRSSSMSAATMNTRPAGRTSRSTIPSWARWTCPKHKARPVRRSSGVPDGNGKFFTLSVLLYLI